MSLFVFKSPPSAAWWLSGGIPAANCIAAYDAKNAASLAASYINLANPGTYNLTLGTAPTWAAGTGWTGNGSTMFLKTGIIPLTLLWSAIIRFSDGADNGNRYLFGAYDGANFFGINPAAGDTTHYYTSGQYMNAVPELSSGILAICARKGYYETTFKVNIPGVTQVSCELYILARNNSGTAGNFKAAAIQELAIYDIDILGYLTALNTAIAAL